jgi:hypothetical protein
MLSAYVLIETEAAKVAQALSGLDGVQFGRRHRRTQRRHRQGSGPQSGSARPAGGLRIQVVDGVTRTLTCMVIQR